MEAMFIRWQPGAMCAPLPAVTGTHGHHQLAVKICEFDDWTHWCRSARAVPADIPLYCVPQFESPAGRGISKFHVIRVVA